MKAETLAGFAPAGPRAGFWKPVPNNSNSKFKFKYLL